MRTIIIEDTDAARNILTAYIKKLCPNLELIDVAKNVKEGLELIKKVKPQLVFLDVEMPDGTGFELLKSLPSIDFKVIFTTAHERYALQAIKFSALDYLLKPIDPEELVEAVAKAKASTEEENSGLKIKTLLQNIEATQNAPKTLVVKDKYGIQLVNIEDIIRLEAMGNYTQFHIKNQSSILVSKTLKEYETMLPVKHFFRSHYSHLVNLDYLLRYDHREGNVLMLKDGSEVPLATRKKALLLERILT